MTLFKVILAVKMSLNLQLPSSDLSNFDLIMLKR